MDTLSKTGKYTSARRVQKRNFQRGNKKQTEITKVRRPVNGFLTSVFEPIHTTEINPLFQADNYNYLYQSARKYASLLGENFILEPDPRNFEAVCDKLDALLPKGQGIRLFVKDNRIHFKIINSIHENLLFYIPCKIIDETDGIFRDILVGFFRLFQREQRLTPLLENQNFEMWKSEVEYYEESRGEEIDDDWRTAIQAYMEGEIGKTLKLVDQKPQYSIDELAIVIDSYTPLDKTEKKILNYIRKGLKFLKAGKIMLHYTNQPRLCDEERAVDADNIFMIVYDDDDLIVENLIHYMNEYANEVGYEFFSSINTIITPETKTLAKEDKFILRFFEWINDFTYVLRNR